MSTLQLTSCEHFVLRSPFLIAQYDTLKNLDRLETSFLSGSVDILEDSFSHLFVLTQRVELGRGDAEFRSFRFDVGLVREDDLSTAEKGQQFWLWSGVRAYDSQP